MRYIVSGEFTEITETSGTIQNTSKINVVEVSDTNEKGSGIMLYPLDRFTFSKSIYARCVDGGGAEVRVVPFEVGTQGGGEQGTTPSGGGSGIAFAGMILGTESSTVDGGLWFEVVDGLPVVKMNYNGSTFALGANPADGALIGDKLYLGGHEFKLTGFADDLALSDNNFYVGGISTPIGSVSNFAFQFTDAAALSVAEGGTISITQLDTDVVDFSLDLGFLNANPLPAPKIIVGVITDLTSQATGTITWHELPVAYGKASLSANVIGGCFYFMTDSTGKVNAVSWPSSALGATRQVKTMWLDKPPTSMTEGMEVKKRWQLVCVVPNYDDPECLGKFVFLLDATDTHSSVRITINVISAG